MDGGMDQQTDIDHGDNREELESVEIDGSLDEQRQSRLVPSIHILDVLCDALPIVTTTRVDLHVSFPRQLNTSILHPLPMQLLQILPSSIRGIISTGILQGRELLFPQGLEHSNLLSLLKNIEIEQFELDSVVLLRSNCLLLSGIPILNLLLSQMIPKHNQKLYFLLMLSISSGSLVIRSMNSLVMYMVALAPWLNTNSPFSF